MEEQKWDGFKIKSTKVDNTEDASIKKDAQTIGGPGVPDVFFVRPIDYRPEFASPERWTFPRDIKQRNNYWRTFYMTDAVAGTVVDMYVEMPLSDYDIVGAGVEGEIKQMLEDMCDELRLLQLLSSVMKEFLVVGEAVPHLFFDKTEGYWVDWSMHKPENIEVVDTQLAGVESLLWFKAEADELKQVRKMLKAIDSAGIQLSGRKFLENMMTQRKVLLEPLNVSFVPRLMHAYDTRGMSLYSRLWRVFMWEDAIANATLQTAKRHASPVKVVKMGDVVSGFIPTKTQQDDLLRALGQSEVDPHAWIIVPPTTTFEAWGTVDKVMGMRQEYDTIEKVKLMALGTSRDFISGASTFAAAQAGLQVFLSRLLSFRTFMEEVFVYPKVFGVIAKVNKWVVPTKAEVDHKIKVRRNDERVVKPKLRWEKALKIRVDRDLLEAYRTLTDTFNIKISERTIAGVGGIDWEDELRKSLEEESIKKIIGEKAKKEPMSMEYGYEPDTPVDIGVEENIPEPEYIADEGPVPMHAESKRNNKQGSSKRDVFLSGVYKGGRGLPKIIEKENLG